MHSTTSQKSLFQFKTVLSLWTYLWPKDRPDLKTRLKYAVGLLFFSKLSSLCVPFLFKFIIDGLYPAHSINMTFIFLIIIGYGLARALAQGLNEVKDAIFSHVTQNAVRVIGLETFNKLHRLGLTFHLDRKTGHITRIIEKGTTAVESFLRFTTFNIFPTLLEVTLVTLTLCIVYGWRYALTLFGILFLYIVFTLIFTEWRTNFVRKMNKIDADANAQAIDSLLNYESIKYFGAENYESQRYSSVLGLYEKAAIKSFQTLALLNGTQGLIVSGGLVLTMMMAVMDVRSGLLTPGDFALLVTCLIQLYMPLNILGFAYRETKLALLNMETMFETLREPESIQDQNNAKPLVLTQGRVEFKNVTFSYGDKVILNHISFTLEPGQIVAIVGASGAGKSTLSRLLFRFYDPDEGHIYIDDQDIRCVTQKSLRAHMGIVPQDTVLFNETILYNIAYGREGAALEDVQNVTKKTHIHDFIEKLPKGYNTIVGERGLKLSGGEKQRIAIARTLLKNPDIMIFDEATSALDTHTEQNIQRSLFDIAKNRTTLMIAHRLSTIVDADQILVLDKGTIVERGPHNDLMALKGLYYDLWSKQTKETPH